MYAQFLILPESLCRMPKIIQNDFKIKKVFYEKNIVRMSLDEKRGKMLLRPGADTGFK